MNVIGYDEALASVIEIEIEEHFVVPLISLSGLALLKLFAWRERGIENPKDAWDLVILLTNYREAGIEDRLYSEEINLLEAAGFDPTNAAPVLLGKDVRSITKPERLQKCWISLSMPSSPTDLRHWKLGSIVEISHWRGWFYRLVESGFWHADLREWCVRSKQLYHLI